VSVAVSALVSNDLGGSCKFAVRSGGHTIWAGAANIENGVTIDLSNLDSVIYNEEDSSASIGPGARWVSVYDALEKHSVTVPGGRAGTVGVGGLILGGKVYSGTPVHWSSIR
jgi:FAD/FMN-containing dehydrogenase